MRKIEETKKINSTVSFINEVVKQTNNNVLEIRSFDKEGVLGTKFFSDYIEAVKYVSGIKNNHDVYFGIASRKDNTSGKKENCATLSALYIDVDCGTTGHKKQSLYNTKEETLNHIKKIKFPIPSYIVDSGHGFHLYWLLKDQVDLNANTIPELETIMKQIGYLYGGDSTQNVDRIFRLPYTFNFKDKNIVESKIIHQKPEYKYELKDFTTNELYKIPIDNIFIKGKEKNRYYHALFNIGTEGWGKDSNSEIDQTFITFLISKGFSESDIRLIFQNFPTTGKYFEHGSGDEYLAASIKNAKEFLAEKELTQAKKAGEKSSPDSFQYILGEEPEAFGYLKQTDDGPIPISNFVIKFTKRILLIRNHEPLSYFIGKIQLQNNEEILFDKFDADLLADPRALIKFVSNYCGTKASILGSSRDFIEAVKSFNKDIPEQHEREFGYNKDLTEYITEDMRITKEGIEDVDCAIKYSDDWGINHLGFKKVDEGGLKLIKRKIVEKLFEFDSYHRTLNVLAMALIAVVYPFMKANTPNKFYSMFLGQSGAGKSELAKVAQRFYGEFETLTSVSSTPNAIAILGSAFKDTTYIIDDLKKENFHSSGDVSRFSTVLQNYSDGNGRKRANKNSSLRDDRFIEGQLIIPAEDLPITQASTIARGIIITFQSKPYMPRLFQDLMDISRTFNSFTPYYIQYVLQNYDTKNVSSILRNNKERLNEQIVNIKADVSYDNLARCINNFAQLKTSWDIASEFLLEDDAERQKYNQLFQDNLLKLLIENLDRLNSSKQEVRFEETLWDMVASEKLYFEGMSPLDSVPYKATLIGAYEISEENIKISINLNIVYREVSKELGDLGMTLDALKDRLLKKGKIRIPGNGNDPRVSFSCNRKRRGYEWTGDFPKHLFHMSEETKESIEGNKIPDTKETNISLSEKAYGTQT